MVAMFIFNGLASRTSSKLGLFLINVTMPADDITGPDMNGQKIVFGEISDREGNNQRPMENSYERVPDID